MKRLPLVMLVLAAAVFSSCQKEVDPTLNGPDETKKYLLRFIQTETSSPGEASVLLFEYDAQKRVTKMTEQYVDTVGGVAQITDQAFYHFYYNGNESRPYKVTDALTDPELSLYFKFDAQGKKLQDSLVDGNTGESEVTRYTYAGNKVFAEIIVDVLGTELIYRDTIEFTGDNVSRQMSGHYQDGMLVSLYEQKFTFDDHPNPFNQLNINTSFFASAYNEFGTFLGLNKNNFVTVIQQDLVSPPDIWNEQYRYTYDADGYPVTIEFSTFGIPGLNGKIRYEYLP